MSQIPASHRSIALLTLVVLASRGLSFSRGNLNDIGVICFAFVLAGLVPVLLLGWRWQQSSDSQGGFPT
jgi:ABC-type amino acid transport system permease subunit